MLLYLQGYHFPDGPYVGKYSNRPWFIIPCAVYIHVEYIGNIPAEMREQVLQDLNREAMRLVKV